MTSGTRATFDVQIRILVELTLTLRMSRRTAQLDQIIIAVKSQKPTERDPTLVCPAIIMAMLVATAWTHGCLLYKSLLPSLIAVHEIFPDRRKTCIILLIL
jgi:hypothetical protein